MTICVELTIHRLVPGCSAQDIRKAIQVDITNTRSQLLYTSQTQCSQVDCGDLMGY